MNFKEVFKIPNNHWRFKEEKKVQKWGQEYKKKIKENVIQNCVSSLLSLKAEFQ